MKFDAFDSVPGFRRRFRITPAPGRVVTEVEDDYHRMRVTIEHDSTSATAVRAELIRAPWTTCPGAAAKCEQTFAGVTLAEFPAQRGKAANCTHLYDLAVLAAAHAADDTPLEYDIFVTDPVDDVRQAAIFRDGEPVLAWRDREFRITEPADLAGCSILDVRSWLGSLAEDRREAARLLSWGSVIARGRTIPMERQSDASAMPASCYTFQPEQAVRARRVGKVRDFSDGRARPLEEFKEVCDAGQPA